MITLLLTLFNSVFYVNADSPSENIINTMDENSTSTISDDYEGYIDQYSNVTYASEKIDIKISDNLTIGEGNKIKLDFHVKQSALYFLAILTRI